ncbi:MAG: squalene/phytoene synthase family protein [Proteobacteria bacterium]|nr:squalene/phytoene synthase family protein [Pseudomonadota bacterium]
MTDPVAIARGQRLCREIAGRANANFLHAARLLPGFRQDFFFATYAAMRVIDDRVDEDFLTLPAQQRDAERDEARRAISDWLSQSTIFDAAGESIGDESTAGPLHPDGVAALADTAGRSDLGAWPWRALAGALLSDVEEREMRSWEDFLEYCAGATVAPAAIFIYLLAARHDPASGYRYELPRAARDYAKDLAIYCYIVHILRDLAKDAGRSPRLITIPSEILAAAGLTRDGLSAALAEKSPAIGVLAGLLISKAEPFKAAGHAALREVGGHLGMVERLALNGLIAVYDRLFASAGKDALGVAINGPAMEAALRRDLLRPADEG